MDRNDPAADDRQEPLFSRLCRPEVSRVVLVDLQERLVPVIDGGDSVVSAARFLADAAALFDVPVTVTEQYPRGLGTTVEPLKPFASSPVEKLRFSASAATPADDTRELVVLAGVETHVCVAQTALEMLADDCRVLVAVDAVGSRRRVDHDTALARLRDLGIEVTTTEAIAFEWCRSAEHARFRDLSALVKARGAESSSGAAGGYSTSC
ncbi:MAG: isochorismatase family protein [Planctomycetota bacterium]